MKHWQWLGFGVVTLGGTILHFLYDWTVGSIWVAPFSGVNESTWEHMKLLFWPLFLFAVVQRLFFREQENFWRVKLRGILLAPLYGIASTAGVCTLCDFCKNQLCRFCEKFEIFDLLAKMQSSVASRARRYPLCIFAVMLKHTWQTMHRGTHSCVLVGKHPKPFNNFGEIGYAPLVLIDEF